MRKLGVTLTEDVYKATHLVANGKILRTAKFLSAVNLGLKITTREWLDASIKAGDLLEADEFPLVDEAHEKELGCNLRESLERARKGRQATDPPSKKGTLFQGYKFYFLGSSKETSQLEQIVESAGGQVSTIKRMGYQDIILKEVKCNIKILLLFLLHHFLGGIQYRSFR